MECKIARYQAQQLKSVAALWRRARWGANPEIEARAGHTLEDDERYFGEVVAVENEVWIAFSAEDSASTPPSTRRETTFTLPPLETPLGLLAQQGDVVAQLYVDPPFQRRGIGSRLLAHARTLSPQKLTLFTHVSNSLARQFYEKHEFRAIKFGVSPPPENEPDVKYEWRARQDIPPHKAR